MVYRTAPFAMTLNNS